MAKQSLLPSDYEGLLEEYKVQKKELENFRQHLYDSTRQLKVNESLLVEYQSEIEHLRSGESNEKKKYETRIMVLEENIQNIRASHAENQGLFEAELAKKEIEIETLKSDLDHVKKTLTASPLDITNNHFEDLQFLKDENDILKESYNELKENMEVVQQQCRELEQTVDQYKDEINQLRTSLDIKRDELSENVAVVEKLNDELTCVKCELAALKQKPLDEQSKGNSLFAEVDDRRVHLQQTINTMKSEYVRMKQELTQQQKVVSGLRKQNAELCDKWKKDIEEIEEDRMLIKKSYKDRIYTLEQLVEKLHRDLEVKPHNVTEDLCAEYDFYTNMIKSREEEIRELERKINRYSSDETGMTIELAQAHKETRKWHNEAIKLRQDKDAQRTSILPRDSSNFKVPLPVKVSAPLKSCIKTEPYKNHTESYRKILQESYIHNESIRFEEEDLENATQTTNFDESEVSNLDIEEKENLMMKRAVKFCDSVSAEPKITLRKGSSRVFDLETNPTPDIVKKVD